jgi:Tol biopolymer transport system component
MRRNRRVPVVIVAVIGLALVAVSGASSRPLRSSASPSWVLFTAQTGGLGGEQIFRITTTGTGLKQLTSGGAPSEDPVFSPNGKRIAFARLGGGIYTMNVDGTGLRRLTTNSRDGFPTWSPNGQQIAFKRPSANGWDVYVMSASGGGQRRLPQAPSAGRPSWTANGLVIPSNGDLVKIDPRTGHVLKRFGALIDAMVGQDSTAVAPNLSTLTFVGSRPPIPGDKGCGEGVPCPVFALYIQNLAQHKAPRTLVRDAGPATFSHDGKSLVFVNKGRIVFWTLKNGASRSIATGKLKPSTSAPPSLQP